MGHAVFGYKSNTNHMLFFALVGLLTLWSSVVSANTSGSEKSLEIQACFNSVSNINSREYVEKRMQTNGWSQEAIRLHFDYQRSLLQDPIIKEKYCANMVDAFRDDFDLVNIIVNEEAIAGYSETAVNLGYQLITGYFGSGMKRISSNELKPYFDFTYELFNVLEPELCEKFWRPNASDTIDLLQVLVKYQGLISLEVQKQYLEMSRKAVLAEVTNRPSITTIEESEARKLDAFVGNWLMQYSKEFSEPYRLGLMLNGRLVGTPEEYCELGRFYYGALATAPGRDGDRARKYIADSLN